MDGLLRCPFCGGEAELVFSGQMRMRWKGFILCKCQTCGGAGKGIFYEGEPIEIDLYDTVGGEKAIKYWNRRW